MIISSEFQHSRKTLISNDHTTQRFMAEWLWKDMLYADEIERIPRNWFNALYMNTTNVQAKCRYNIKIIALNVYFQQEVLTKQSFLFMHLRVNI